MAITIPETQYVGVNIHRSSDGSMPLGFLTPGGTNAAAKKRISTVNNWVGASSMRREYCETVDKAQFEKDNPTAEWITDNTHNPNNLTSQYNIPKVADKDYRILDNVPNEARAGFRITKMVSRGSSWNGGNKLVRIEDPRGFELEISVDNLVKVMSMTTFIDGVCQEECVWGREGSTNILLPVNSDPYKEAVDTTKYRAKANISLRDVNFGDTVELKKTEYFEGMTGIYLGAYHVACLQSLNSVETGRNYGRRSKETFDIIKVIKRYVIKVGDTYMGVASAKIHKIINKVDTPVERFDIDATSYTETSYNAHGAPIALSTKKITAEQVAATVEFVPAPTEDVMEIFNKSKDASGSYPIWANDIKNDRLLRMYKPYRSPHYRNKDDDSDEELRRQFIGQVTTVSPDENIWQMKGQVGEEGRGIMHILKNPGANAALIIEDYNWLQMAITVNDKQRKVDMSLKRFY